MNLSFFLHIPYRFNLIPDNVMVLRILKWKCACGNSFVKIIWNLLSLKMTTTLRKFGHKTFFLQKLSENKGMQKLRKLVEVIVCTFNNCFSVCSISLVASVMLNVHLSLYVYMLAYNSILRGQSRPNFVWLSGTIKVDFKKKNHKTPFDFRMEKVGF